MKKDDSDLPDYADEDEASHFHMEGINFGNSYFQFAQLDEEFEPCIASILNQTAGRNVSTKTKLNLREVILLDIQLTMNIVGKTLAGYTRGRPLPVLPRMGRPLPVLPRIRPRLPRGAQRVSHDDMPRQTLTFTRAISVTSGDMPSQ